MGKSDAIFQGLQKAVEKDGEKMVKQVKAIFAFKIKEGGAWLVNLKDGKGIPIRYLFWKTRPSYLAMVRR